MDFQREDDLVAAAKAGSLPAFLELVRAYQRPVYRLAYALTSDPIDASALAAKAFVQAWLGIDDLPEGQRFLSWVLRAARDRSPNPRRQESGAAPSEAAEREDRDRILAAFAGLQAEEKIALALRVAERARYEDIAAWLGVSVAVAALRISQARGLLLSNNGTSEGEGV